MNQSRKRLSRVAVPSLAALAVAGVALAVYSSAAPSAHAPSSNMPGKAAARPVHQATAGDSDDPAMWRLPIEAYMPTKAQSALISSSRDELIDACMAKAGFPDWTPAPDLPQVGGKTLTDWRYGIHDAALAAKRGYHPDAGEQRAYDQAIDAGAVDESKADKGTLRGCVSQVDGQVPESSAQADLVQQIDGESYTQSATDPRVKAVFAQWSSCMKDKGFTYATPMDANNDDAFGDMNTVTDKEIATATADITCRDKYQVAKTWFSAEVTLQQTAIAAHQDELDQVVAETKTIVDKARAAVR
ncbi:hypothetical protein [Streptomyces sp. VMFN-G11Ma]|uniref:hypothetical protein n=1 Tax=Streptomyces sp. VMFN-G11Ma TaxID=2135609 RepID=UPI000D4B1C5D|nr:hypothetical protein [Streptomyces sp. VMFN-G11Ma]PTM99475.1 hypothetical protein C7821_102422 [Streptomyces sp. VMFN-G11Ma]